jgi:hypothetical protein
MELEITKKIDSPRLKEAWKKMEQARGVSSFLYYDYMRFIWQQEKRFSSYTPVVACVMEGDETDAISGERDSMPTARPEPRMRTV